MPEEFQLNIMLTSETLGEIDKIREFLELPSNEDAIGVAVSMLKTAVEELQQGREIGFYSRTTNTLHLVDLKGKVGEEFANEPSPVHPYSLN